MAPVVVKTWAPRAHTPIIKQKTRSHKKITVVGAICATPSLRRIKFYFRLHPDKNLKAKDCVEFLRQLEQNIHTPIMILWDRLPVHRSKTVQRFIHEHPRMSSDYFPPYAPDLNPIEYSWGYLKTKPLRNFAPENELVLNRRTKVGICQIRRQPGLLRSFVNHSHLFGGLSRRRPQ